MENYIKELRSKYYYPNPKKPHLSLHKHSKINYGTKTQYMPNADDSTKLDDKVIKRVQITVGALLYYSRDVNIKILVSLNNIVSQQASSTENINEAIDLLLYYVATYPNDGIAY